MNIEKLIELGLDYEEGLKRFMGNKALYEKFLNKFPLDNAYNNLCEAFSNKDYKNSFLHAHSIKGTCGNLSLNTLYKYCSILVESLRNNILDNVENEFNEFSELYIKVCNAIKE